LNKDYRQTENKSTPKKQWNRDQVVKGGGSPGFIL
jgi:hypothetical protein